ncbi:prepilin-type N-terminal cleavage/methylation domain-containing protein [Pseudomonas gingeri]|uniref:type II secretion system protein GspJ n=1 Tax=Pseudomonas gingeri TaxID=117681 RepID=UPI0015A11FC2|nr:prepilin-type N-terminal cleavage/methylation domain-containing protein [Pseudomonas gingeri]NVZ66487.1 prepilin-type N-terminal cleavage/methylation domain-containing protein [Pseudomonas gingeri]NVZ74576.1 prepilin-type N-terminal cleavage/methylation domain-containing protein [Pseudomonas gingeri]
MKRQAGFTLIEVMIAIMLMAVVSIIAWRGLDSVNRADEHLKASAGQTRQLLAALGQLERDVALRAGMELVEPPIADKEPLPSQAPAALTVRSPEGKGFRLDLIRTAAEQDGSLQRVRWWLQGGTLYRAVAPARTRFPLPAPKDGVAVLEQVTSMELRVWQPGKGWRRLTGTQQDNPTGLEISLVRNTPQGLERYRQVLGPLE